MAMYHEPNSIEQNSMRTQHLKERGGNMENPDQANLGSLSVEIEKLGEEMHFLLKDLENLGNILQPLRRTQQKLVVPETNEEASCCSRIILEIRGIQHCVRHARNMIDDIVADLEI